MHSDIIANALDQTTPTTTLATLLFVTGLAVTAGCGAVDDATDTGPPDLPEYKDQQATGEDKSGEEWTYQSGVLEEGDDGKYQITLFEKDHSDICSVSLVDNPQPPTPHRIDAVGIPLELGKHEICTDCKDDTDEPNIFFVLRNENGKAQNGYLEIESITGSRVGGRIVAVRDNPGTGSVINGNFDVTRCDDSG